MNIQPVALLALIDAHQAPTIVDVRSRTEFLAGHVPGALHIPFWAMWTRAPALPEGPEGRVVVYCGHGPRAWLAGGMLGRRGFRNVTYLEGHWTAWRGENLREEVGAPD